MRIDEVDRHRCILAAVLSLQLYAVDQVIAPLVAQDPDIHLGLCCQTVSTAVLGYRYIYCLLLTEIRLRVYPHILFKRVGESKQRAVRIQVHNSFAAKYRNSLKG